MRKLHLILLFFLIMGYAQAQIAEWIIPPIYDSIYFSDGANLIVTDSANTKIYWNANGQRLLSATETLNPFSEGYAVLTNDSSAILGFYDTRGNFTSLAEKGVHVANGFPYFTDGYLIIKRNRYYVTDTQGGIDRKKYLKAYPFHNGYAVCRDYEYPQKQKGIANFLIDKNKVEVPLVYNGRAINPADVVFISSVNEEQIAVVIIKKSLYLFNGLTRELSPLVFPNANNGKRPIQAKLESDFVLPSSDAPVIYARCGKNEQVSICFDNQLVPIDIYYNNVKYHYKKKVATSPKPSSPLTAFEKDNLYGLTWNDKPILPAQFEAIGQCFNNLAFVKTAGKQGLMKVVDNLSFNLSINNGNDIAFRHQFYETTIRIDMPTALNPSKVDIEVAPNSGCLIDKISKQPKETPDGNRAEYECKLVIPSTITQNRSEFEYPIQLKYDNIYLQPIQKKVIAWHDKFYDITINDAEKELDKENGLITFPYNIDVDRNANEDVVHFELKVLPDSLGVEIQTISTTRGKCKVPVSELNEGVNYIFIELTEQGCPPINFPFALTYTKPAPKAKRKTVAKEDFKINKKTIQEFEYDLDFPGL